LAANFYFSIPSEYLKSKVSKQVVRQAAKNATRKANGQVGNQTKGQTDRIGQTGKQSRQVAGRCDSGQAH
jgi:hypothetical protein